MSPLWRDEIGIHISPRRVCLIRVRRGLRPSIAAELEQQVEQDAAANWGKPLEVASELLARVNDRPAALRVVLADCWVRYAIVPWASDVRSAAERLGHARQILATVYGDAVSDWEVTLSEAPPYQNRVASTLPVDLIGAIRAISLRYKVRLTSVQPQLVAAYQNWRHCLPATGAWFVSVGDGTLAAARIGGNSWDRVHSVRIGSDWARDLRRLQTFGRLASASPDEGRVFVDAPLAWREVAGPAGRNLHWLEEQVAAPTTLQELGRVQRLGCIGALAA